jgi:hypothetical protein
MQNQNSRSQDLKYEKYKFRISFNFRKKLIE